MAGGSGDVWGATGAAPRSRRADGASRRAHARPSGTARPAGTARPSHARPAHARKAPHRRRDAEPIVRWYRVLPVAVLVLAVAVCALVAAMPTTLGRQIHPVHHASSIRASAERHEVDPLLVCAIISCESGWDEGAVSSAGAVGLMQMMPDTVDTLVSLGFVDATAWNLQNLADPAVNIECGCALISYLQSQFSSVEEVVAAYNAGIGSVQGWLAGGGSIPESIQYPETRLYLEQVLVAYEGYQRSYPDGLPLI